MKEIKASELNQNMIQMFKEEWMLVGAKYNDSYNMMTASWGMIGYLWNKEVVNVYVRPTRYTYEFLENSDTFSCSFFDERYRKQLALCGSKSGREIDKAKECHFTTSFIENAPVFNEAKLTIICRKIAVNDLDSSQFIDKSIDHHYQNDYHRIYTGEIIKILVHE